MQFIGVYKEVSWLVFLTFCIEKHWFVLTRKRQTHSYNGSLFQEKSRGVSFCGGFGSFKVKKAITERDHQSLLSFLRHQNKMIFDPSSPNAKLYISFNDLGQVKYYNHRKKQR